MYAKNPNGDKGTGNFIGNSKLVDSLRSKTAQGAASYLRRVSASYSVYYLLMYYYYYYKYM